MKKNIFALLIIILVASNCNTTRKINKSKRFFKKINHTYPLKRYKVDLITSDSTYHLTPITIGTDGKLYGKGESKDTASKKLIFTTKREFKIAPNADSALNNKILFSKEDVLKVEVYEKDAWPATRIVLDKSKNSSDRKNEAKGFLGSMTLMFAGIILVFLAFISLIALFINSLFSSCYIATMVYKSYDAPEVLVLRKYRDEKLATTIYGRFFIRFYYTISPTFVRLFKKNKLVNKFIKHLLDKWVSKLEKRKLVINKSVL